MYYSANMRTGDSYHLLVVFRSTTLPRYHAIMDALHRQDPLQ